MKRKERSFVEDKPDTKKVKENSLISPLEMLFDRIRIMDDGNCLFRAILYSLGGTDANHKYLREIICKEILNNKKKYIAFFEGGEEGLKLEMENMKNNGIWGTIIELYAASELFAFNFEVYYSNSTNLYCSCVHSQDFPTICLEYENGNHFNLLVDKSDTNKNNNMSTLTKSSTKVTKRNDQKKGNKILKELLVKSREKTSTFNYNTTKNIKSIKEQKKFYDKIKIELTKTVQKPHRTTYPPSRHNSNAYNEVFQYYNEKKIPERFLALASCQKIFNNWVKDIKKRYSLDKVSQNPYSFSRLRFRKENNEEVIIPFEDEIEKIIEIHHKPFGSKVKRHYGIKITVGNIKLKGLYWAGMTNDIQKYISTCLECNQTKYEPPLKQKKKHYSSKTS